MNGKQDSGGQDEHLSLQVLYHELDGYVPGTEAPYDVTGGLHALKSWMDGQEAPSPKEAARLPSESRPQGGPDHATLLSALGVDLDPRLLETALTHRSFAMENGGLPDNGRLEFLGDSVLALVVTGTLFRRQMSVERLAKLRAAMVNTRSLAAVARRLQLGTYILLGMGEQRTGGKDRSSILAGTLEAIIGAVYLDRGLAEASELILRLIDPLIEDPKIRGAGLDWKAMPQFTAIDVLTTCKFRIEESQQLHEGEQ